MFERIDFDYIMKRMLERVPSSMDTREGSIIYDALAPCAAELAILYIQLDNILDETFADTASREFLIRRAAERGIEPTKASYAELRAVFIPDTAQVIGQRFNLEDMNYIVSEKISDGTYKIRCETAGSAGNIDSGSLTPIDYIYGLDRAYVTEILVYGEDEEDTEALRSRYFNSFKTQSFGGNIADYTEKTKSVAGVGQVRITPCWKNDRGGDVRVTILNPENGKASDELIKAVQTALDPDSDGKGYGLAPIGHKVTVDTVDEVSIDINVRIEYEDGYSFDNLGNKINEAIDNYFSFLCKEWENVKFITVRRTDIEASIKTVDGIIDARADMENIVLSPYEIPTRGNISEL